MLLDAAEQALVQINLNKLKQKIAAVEALFASGATTVQYIGAASQILAAASTVAIQLTGEAAD